MLSAPRAARKRRRIGDVELVRGEKEDPDSAKHLKTHIASRQVLTVARARAGAGAIGPAPAGLEKASSDATVFAQAPLDVALAHHFRGKFASEMVFSIA